MAALQQLPYLGTVEEDVLFVEWLVDEGAPVNRGTALATVETLKAAFDVEAEHDGVLLRRLCAPGERVAVAVPIAVIGQPGERCDDERVRELEGNAAAIRTPPATVAAPGPVAPAARRRAAELGIDLAGVRGTGPGGLVRASDVAAAVPAAPRGDGTEGAIEPEFLAMIGKDQAAFAALSSESKLLLYRRHGARIGDGCRLGAGAVLEVAHLVLGAGAVFGAGTVVVARDLHAGELLHFGARCRVRAARIRCGDNAFFADDVEIGGGGAMDPEGELAVGSHGFVGEHVHLNPCRRLQIGDEVVVSRGASIMTHSFGPSWLDGYPSRFAGVSIGDGAQIGIGAVLFPGVEVGAGAVILSGSSVVTAVPAGRLYGGVPAQDLKAAAQQLTPAEVAGRARALVEEFARQLQLRGREVTMTANDAHVALAVRADGGTHRLEFAPVAAFDGDDHAAEQVFVAVDFPDAAFTALSPFATAIGLAPPRIRGPLGPLGAAFREFLRKRGVRLHPRSWAYRGGWL